MATIPAMLIGIDIGSSSVKAVRLGEKARAADVVRVPLGVRRGRNGVVEHDAGAVLAAVKDALSSIRPASGDRLGIATQRSTVLFWDRDSGRPLTPAYSWQDRRGRALCDRLGRRPRDVGSRAGWDPGRIIEDRTGLRLSPHYSASKLAWALRHVAGLRRRVASGTALWGPLGTFLVWHLSAGSSYRVDHANAQRTLLFSLDSLDWDPALFDLFGLNPLVDAPALPGPGPTFLPAGTSVALPNGTRVHLRALTGDQQAAMLGLGCRREGDVAVNLGSGAFVLRLAGGRRAGVPGLLTTLVASWRDSGSDPKATSTRHAPSGRRVRDVAEAGMTNEARIASRAIFALEGTVNAAWTAIEWAQRKLKIRVPIEDLDRFVGPGLGRRRDLHFLPAVSGVGAPRWDVSARPRFFGKSSDASNADLLRAVIDSIAFRCAEILRASGREGFPAPPDRPILVAGGLSCCRTLVQALADLIRRPVVAADEADATVLGVALLARPVRSGTIPLGERVSGRTARPRISGDEAESRFAAWSKAVYRIEA